MRIELHHPIAHHLQANTTDRGRLRAAATVVDHSQRQQPPYPSGERRLAERIGRLI
jgi:hypothetical protein